jgi:hypothetical protein
MLPQASLFTPAEKVRLKELQQVFTRRISDLSETAYHKELERIAIDLSWKSSQIEGNTYSLLGHRGRFWTPTIFKTVPLAARHR